MAWEGCGCGPRMHPEHRGGEWGQHRPFHIICKKGVGGSGGDGRKGGGETHPIRSRRRDK